MHILAKIAVAVLAVLILYYFVMWRCCSTSCGGQCSMKLPNQTNTNSSKCCSTSCNYMCK